MRILTNVVLLLDSSSVERTRIGLEVDLLCFVLANSATKPAHWRVVAAKRQTGWSEVARRCPGDCCQSFLHSDFDRQLPHKHCC